LEHLVKSSSYRLSSLLQPYTYEVYTKCQSYYSQKNKLLDISKCSIITFSFNKTKKKKWNLKEKKEVNFSRTKSQLFRKTSVPDSNCVHPSIRADGHSHHDALHRMLDTNVCPLPMKSLPQSVAHIILVLNDKALFVKNVLM